MIVLQFARGSGIDSQAIEWYGGGPLYSHVDSVMPDGTLLGARTDGGVAIRPATYLGDEPVLRVELPAGDTMTAAYYAGVTAELGKPYDMQGILAFVLDRDWRDPNSWFCSELVAAKLEGCGYWPFPLASPSNKVTPPNLILVLSTKVQINVPEV